MESVSSDDGLDQLSERFESYSLSADVSESESSSCDSSLRYTTESAAVSISLTTSSLVGPKPAVNYRFPELPLKILPPLMAAKLEKPKTDISEVELMKERFAKLLLGEDMSGGGNGVCTALAISNAITNLSVTVFGELWKLGPLAPQKKAMWCREMDWLLSVSNSIVELIPSLQEFPGGGTFEVMVPRPRLDLYVNLPALKKIDTMLLSMLDGFQNAGFQYVDRGVIVSGADEIEQSHLSSSSGRPSIRLEEKWWLPFPKVPPNGLSDEVRKRLQQCRECTNQIHKAAMAINNNVLAEMEIPIVYLDNLPKSGKTCLGEIIYSYMTADHFSPECLLDYLDLSSEYTTLEIANRIEAAAHIWRQKCLKKPLLQTKARRSSWGGKVKGLVGDIDKDKNKVLAQRAETLLQNLRLRFPGLPQTALDTNKIEDNKDVGQSILESYSRVMESLAFNIMARIDDLLYVDDATKQRAAAESISLLDQGKIGGTVPIQKLMSPSPFTIQQAHYDLPFTTAPVYPSNLIIGSPGKRRSSTKEWYPNNPLSGN